MGALRPHEPQDREASLQGVKEEATDLTAAAGRMMPKWGGAAEIPNPHAEDPGAGGAEGTRWCLPGHCGPGSERQVQNPESELEEQRLGEGQEEATSLNSGPPTRAPWDLLTSSVSDVPFPSTARKGQ